MTFFSKQADAFANAVEAQNTAQPTQSHSEPEESPAPNGRISEAQKRIAKANYYIAILNDSLFGDDDSELALEVEDEFRDFAQQRLDILVGMQAEKEAVESPFSPEQEEVLREWADRLVAKPQLLGVVAGQPQSPTPKPVAAPPKPQVNRVTVQQPQEPPKRGRGRPPGSRNKTPTLHKTEVAAPAPTVDSANPLVKIDENGNKYFEQEGIGLDGKKKLIKMQISGIDKPVDHPAYKPMPSEDTALQAEMMQAANMQQKLLNSHPKMGQVLDHLLKG